MGFGSPGFAGGNAKLLVAIGGLATPTQLVWGSPDFNPGNGLALGCSDSDADDTELRNPIDLNGATRMVQTNYNDRKADPGITIWGASTATISGVISGSAGSNLSVGGGGILRLSGANTYVGTTAVGNQFNNATLVVSSLGNGALAPNASTSVGAASSSPSAAVILGFQSNATDSLVYVGPGEVSDRNIQLNSSCSKSIDASGAGPLVLTNVTINPSPMTLTLQGVSQFQNMISSDLDDNAGVFSITKNGGGTWVLSGTNGYTGTTTVKGGCLLINGRQTDAGGVNALTGAILGGNGSVMGAVTVNNGGFLSPGAALGSAGAFHTGNLSLANGSTLALDINGTTPGASYDQLDVTGSVSLAAALTVSLNCQPAPGDAFWIIANDQLDGVSGGFNGIPENGLLAVSSTIDGEPYYFRVLYDANYESATTLPGTGNDVVLVNVAVPEPISLVLALLGLVGTSLWSRRRCHGSLERPPTNMPIRVHLRPNLSCLFR